MSPHKLLITCKGEKKTNSIVEKPEGQTVTYQVIKPTSYAS